MIAALAALATGCGGGHSTYKNLNTGERGNLSLRASRVTALLDPTPVVVERSQVGTYDCAWEPDPLGIKARLGTGPREHCEFNGTASPVVALLEASCDPVGCIAVIDGTGQVLVIGLALGSFTLTVTAKLADGTVLTDSTPMTFVKVDGIALTCTRTYSCPGPNAILPGASFSWSAQPLSEGQRVTGTVSIALDQPGVVEVTGDANKFTVRALKPGVATLRLRSGLVQRLQTIRVAAFEDVVAGSVRLGDDGACLRTPCVDAEVNQVGDAAPTRFTTNLPPLVLAWVLRDGSLAVGGAGRLTTPTPGIKLQLAGSPAPNPDDLELMKFYVVGAGSVSCDSGRITLVATLGTARLDYSFVQACR